MTIQIVGILAILLAASPALARGANPLSAPVERVVSAIEASIERARRVAPFPAVRCEGERRSRTCFQVNINEAVFVAANDAEGRTQSFDVTLQPHLPNAALARFSRICTAMLMVSDRRLNVARADAAGGDLMRLATNATRGIEYGTARRDGQHGIAFFVTATPSGHITCALMQDDD